MSALAPFDRAGVAVEVRDGRIFVPDASGLTDDLRAHVAEHRETIVLELVMRKAATSCEADARARAVANFRRQPTKPTPVLLADAEPEATPDAGSGAGPWWESRGWNVDAWIAEVEAEHVFVEWDGESTRLVAPRGYVPPWVASDRHALERAGVLQRHFHARSALQTREPK